MNPKQVFDQVIHEIATDVIKMSLSQYLKTNIPYYIEYTSEIITLMTLLCHYLYEKSYFL